MPRNASAIVMDTECACCHRNFSRSVRNPMNPTSAKRSSDLQHLCEGCYDEAGFENAHNDGHHETPDAGCYVCNGTDAHPFLPVVAEVAPVRVGAGRVASEADGRLKPNAPTLPENPARVKLTGVRLGQPAPKYVGQASVIKADNHVWGGHSNWVMVIVDGMTQRRWFWAEDVTPVRAPRARRTAVAA